MGLNLQATIGLNSASFEKGLDRVRERVADSVKSFVIGAIGVAGIEEAFRKTVETANELVNSSQRLDTSVEQLQVLREAAKDAGVEFDNVAASLNKLNEARSKALGGDKKSLVAFKALGVNLSDLQTKKAGDIFQGPIAGTVSSTNVEQITEPLKEIFGKGFSADVGVLRTNFSDLSSKMTSYGDIMSTESAVKLKIFDDELSLVNQMLLSEFAPALVALGKVIFDLVSALGAAGTFYGSLAGSIGAFLAGKSDFGDSSTFSPIQDAKEYWKQQQAVLAAFDQKSKEIADRLNNPRPPDFSKTATVAKAMNPHGITGRVEADSLIKVGNFLGSSRAVINSAQARLEAHAATTAARATEIVSILRQYARGPMQGPQPNLTQSQHSWVGRTEWPSN